MKAFVKKYKITFMLPVALCVDDELILLKSLEYELEDYFSDIIEIKTAQNPNDAFEVIEETLRNNQSVFLVISDHHLMGADGVEFLKELHTKYPTIQKILLTGYKNFQIEKDLKKNYNVHAVLEKPWLTEEIIKNVKECLDMHLRS